MLLLSGQKCKSGDEKKKEAKVIKVMIEGALKKSERLVEPWLMPSRAKYCSFEVQTNGSQTRSGKLSCVHRPNLEPSLVSVARLL